MGGFNPAKSRIEIDMIKQEFKFLLLIDQLDI